MTTRKRKYKRQEVLSKPVNPSGEGEDPAVKAVLSDEFLTMPDTDAVKVALALERVINGQDSILERMAQEQKERRKLTETLSKLQARMEMMEKARIKWETDQKKFLDELYGRVGESRLTPEERAKLEAREIGKLQSTVNQIQVGIHASRQKFIQKLNEEPKEVIVSPGVTEMVNINGQVSLRVKPEVISIKLVKFVLPPGKPIEVPCTIAQRWREKHQEEEAAQKLKAVLERYPAAGVAAMKWGEILKQSGYSVEENPFRIGEQ